MQSTNERKNGNAQRGWMQRHQLIAMPVAGFVALCAAAVLPGCLVTSHNREDVSGRKISSSTMSRIQPGQTDRTWVKATLGEPTSREKLNDGELWKYSYARVKSGRGTVLFVFSGSSSEQVDGGTSYIEFDEAGIVRRTWQSN